MKTQKCTCLQITHATVRRADMIWSGGSWECVRSALRPLPAFDGVNDPLFHPALPDTMRSLLAESKPQQVYVSISSSEVLLKWIELPDAVPDTTDALKHLAIQTILENETYIPISLASAAYDYQLMTPTTLLMGWMRKSRLASFAEQLNGGNLVYLAPQSVTLANQLLTDWDGSERICGVYVDGGVCDLAVVEADVCFGRSFVFGEPAVLWRTIRHSLANSPNPSGAALQRIVVFHNAADSPGSVLTPEQAAEESGAAVTESAFDWHTALLKPGQTDDTAVSLNLMAPVLAERAVRQKLKRKRRLQRLIPIAAILLLLFANGKLYDAVESKRAGIEALRLERSELKTLQKKTQSLQERAAGLEGALGQLAWGGRHFPPLADRLVQIGNCRPAGVRLTEIRTFAVPQASKARAVFEAREVLLVVGVAEAQASINAFRAALVTQPQFSSVRQVKTEQTLIADERWLQFTLALTSPEGGS